MKTSLRFAAQILRRLGEELNPNIDQGIVELAKNSYDADATVCRLELVKDGDASSIRMTDDGDGMTARDIKDSWLVLGRSQKKQRKVTRLGRTPAGNKGLGRLAALRLGRLAILTTRPRREPKNEYRLLIDWNHFDRVRTVDEVGLTIVKRARSATARPGTELELRHLRAPISKDDLSRLARALVLLADPFVDDPLGFKPALTAPEYADLEQLVSNRYFAQADFHLEASLDARGRGLATLTDWQGRILFEGKHAEICRGERPREYHCPPTHFDVWVFLLDRTSFATRAVPLSDVKEWLHAFGGIHVYLNGLRVAPYGNPGNDWLDVNLKRSRSPEERFSTNTAIGRLKVRDEEERFQQKTDRSGFIEGEAFAELKRFATDSLEWMARRRMDLAMKRRARARQQAPTHSQIAKASVENAIASAPSKAKREIEAAFDAYQRIKEHEVKVLRKEVQLSRTLSTAGIAAATFAHEAQGNPLKVIVQSVKAIERRGKADLGERYAERLQGPVEDITRAVDVLGVLGDVTLSLVQQHKRRPGQVDLNRVVANVLTTYKPVLDGRDISVNDALADGSLRVHASEAALESIVTNLLNNSLSAFEGHPQETRTVRIATTLHNGAVMLEVDDNGPGIKGIALNDIWLPGETTKPNGTGLGLSIVRDTVIDLGGSVSARANGRLGGAGLSVTLPLVGTSNES